MVLRRRIDSELTTVITLDSTNDRIGINDTTPLQALDVTGNIAVTGSLGAGITTPTAKIHVKQSSDDWNNGLKITDTDSSDSWEWIISGGALVLSNGGGGNERMWIKSTGETGIGNNNPSQALDVTGNIAVSGTVDGVDVSAIPATYVAKAGDTMTGNLSITKDSPIFYIRGDAGNNDIVFRDGVTDKAAITWDRVNDKITITHGGVGIDINAGNISMAASKTVDGVDVSAHAVATTGVHGVGANTLEHTGNKNIANGYAGLDASGDVPLAQLAGITNAEIAAGAAIAASKLSGVEATTNKNAASGYAGLDTNRDIPHIRPKAASANLRHSHDAEVIDSTAYPTYAKLKTITFANGISGTLRISFEIHAETSGTARGRIYKNGEALGTEQSETSYTYVTKTEDINVGIIAPGGTIELWGNGAFSRVFVQNLRISYDNAADTVLVGGVSNS